MFIISYDEVSDRCRKCGAQVSPGYSFCLSCGTKFSELPPTTKERPATGVDAVVDLADKVTLDGLLCFIATAAYGSHLSPQVTFLRFVRDKKLKQSRLGDLFVNRFEWLYYKFSPNVAKVMYRYPIFKRMMKWLLVTPIVYFLMSIFKPADTIRKRIKKVI